MTLRDAAGRRFPYWLYDNSWLAYAARLMSLARDRACLAADLDRPGLAPAQRTERLLQL